MIHLPEEEIKKLVIKVENSKKQTKKEKKTLKIRENIFN